MIDRRSFSFPKLGLSTVAVLACSFLAGASVPAAAQVADSEVEQLQDEAVQWLRDYVQVNTINPPGNETAGVEFLAGILDAEGIAYETAESAPGRGNLWARLEGGDGPAIILLHHIDVVPADESRWTVDPLGGEVRDEHIYGRGTLDTKALGILQLATFIGLHRSGVALDRDVIYMATADEEAGGFFGAGWLVENRPELFEDVGAVLNEGGGGTLDGTRAQFGIEVTQKVPVWLRLHATGTPGHGSRPRPESAVTRIVRALDRIREHRFTPRILPPVDAMFKAIAPTAGEEWESDFMNMQEAVEDSEFMNRLQLHDPSLAGVTRNTCSITMLKGSDKINVVPPTAEAELDCRVLPDQDVEAFIRELGTVISDSNIEIETIMAFTPAISSTETDVYRSLVSVTSEYFPDAVIMPSVQTGFTDSHFFRDLGIHAYGYSPSLLPLSDVQGVHGNDERISIENVRRGVAVLIDVMERIVATVS